MTRWVMRGALLLGLAAACAPAPAKVFFRVAASALPRADKTAIQDLVLSWPVRDSAIITHLRDQGYNVWLQCDAKDFLTASSLADRLGGRGLIITSPTDSNQFPATEISSYAAVHKRLAFRVLVPGGKQPQMKGRLVVERDGILQVSSPSTQPWLDTNLAVVKLTRSIFPDASTILYDFRWATPEIRPGAWYPDSEDYALAIAESDAILSDVIIDLPISLQKALITEDPNGWALWRKVVPYLNFSYHAPTANVRPVANLGVVVRDVDTSYEAVNLMARHNLAFEAVRPSALTPDRLRNWNSVVVFCSMNAKAIAILRDFAANGGIVLFVNSRDKFPWHSTAPVDRQSHAATYSVGRGQIVELDEPVIDPENFARDLRRLIGSQRSALALWNSLTTLATVYRERGHRNATLYLVNYAEQPDNVQVQIKGRFTGIRLESPEQGCCATLRAVERNGFTEFTVPSLRIAARVHLDSKEEGSAAQERRKGDR